MNDIVGSGAAPYMWNIATAEFNGSCPFKLRYVASSDYGDNRMDKVFTFYSGPSCNVSRTIIAPAEGDPDPHTGQMRILKQKQAGDTYEVCFLYVELGVAHVYRKCLVDNGTNPSGQACAAIYIAQAQNTKGSYSSSKFTEFIDQLGVDFPKISVECRLPAD